MTEPLQTGAPIFDLALRYVRRWGIEVRLVPDGIPDYTSYPYGRFFSNNHGIIEWPDRRIWWRLNYLNKEAPNELLHELGHCLDKDDPDTSEEATGPVLAFEYYSTRFLGLPGWSDWMYAYQIDVSPDKGLVDWPKASTSVRHGFLQKSLSKAVQRGILTQDGKPTFRLPRGVRAAHVKQPEARTDRAGT